MSTLFTILRHSRTSYAEIILFYLLPTCFSQNSYSFSSLSSSRAIVLRALLWLNYIAVTEGTCLRSDWQSGSRPQTPLEARTANSRPFYNYPELLSLSCCKSSCLALSPPRRATHILAGWSPALLPPQFKIPACAKSRPHRCWGGPSVFSFSTRWKARHYGWDWKWRCRSYGIAFWICIRCSWVWKRGESRHLRRGSDRNGDIPSCGRRWLKFGERGRALSSCWTWAIWRG